MLIYQLNIASLSICLEFLLLLTAISSPEKASSCETLDLEIQPLHDDGLIIGKNAILACLHSYQLKEDCIIDWSTETSPVLDEYLMTKFNSPLSDGAKMDGKILIIPNVSRADSQNYTCKVRHPPGQEVIKQSIFHLRVHDPLPPRISESNNSITNERSTLIEEGTRHSIDCNAVGYPIPSITWYKNSIQITDICYEIETEAEPCLNHNSSTLTIFKMGEKSEGKYNCTVSSEIGIDYASTWIISMPTGSDSSKYNELLRILNDSNILLQEPLVVDITDGNKLDQELKFTCFIAGWPIPNVTWNRNPGELDLTRIEVVDQNELVFKNITPELSGTYGCEDQAGTLRMYRELRVESQFANLVFNPKNSGLVNFIYVFIFISLLIICFFFIRYWIRPKDSDFMEEFSKEFFSGRLPNLNRDVEIKDQADCLPYDHKIEFPRQRLKLGKQLGSGAFGMVMFGEARGIIRKGLNTPVAVKMAKNNYEQSQIRALASELKIMMTIGKHLNIVNLLGACTQPLTNLLVITEYCPYGNLHDFLLTNRDIFRSQVDHYTGLYKVTDIKSTILQQKTSASYVESDKVKVRKTRVNYFGQELKNKQSPENDKFDYVASFSKDSTLGKGSEEKCLDDSLNIFKGANIPKVNAESNHYEIDLPKVPEVEDNIEIQSICTDDLYFWAYQIAKGMEYLSNKKIVHGDLAIRNVLLCNHNIVKISDFGLSKNVYHYTDENYVKKSKQALPVKWMALESIADRIFSTHSDAWTYGIVLWELFSLAETPYATFDFENMYKRLKLGYRMERPLNATKDIHRLMLACWNKEPKARPSFTSICTTICDLLESSLREYYFGLVEYIEENPNNIHEDYYLVMYYNKQLPELRPELSTLDGGVGGGNNEIDFLEVKEVKERAPTPGYMDMHGCK